MSDLAPFVAAALRDKVVSDLHQEVLCLQKQLDEQKAASQQVTITGPMGSPIYTRADFRQHGKFDVSPELWKVEFGTADIRDHHEDGESSSSVCNPCTLAELSEMEVRIGGILKAKWSRDGNDDSIEGFVNDIDNNYSTNGGTLSIWFGGSSGIWLTILLVGIEKEAYARLRDLDLSGGRNLWSILMHQSSPEARIEFIEVSFMISHVNHAMEAWGMPTEPLEEEEEGHSI